MVYVSKLFAGIHDALLDYHGKILPHALQVGNASEAKWTELAYRVAHKEPWYKGGEHYEAYAFLR